MLTESIRGHETSRIEAFSDGVFAFALTLLVVFTLLYWRAYTMATPLGLSAADTRRAWIGMRTHLLSVAVGVVYAALGPLHAAHGWWSRNAISEAQV